MRDFQPCVYLLANRYRGAIYTGVTSDLPGRIYQHREETLKGFTSRYAIKRLVWFQVGEDIEGAIRREKTIKRWPRRWKFNLIEQGNPDWLDLAVELGFPALAAHPR